MDRTATSTIEGHPEINEELAKVVLNVNECSWLSGYQRRGESIIHAELGGAS
jgi:hypothetical protein